MNIQIYNLGNIPAGAQYLVILRGSTANVRLLDETNYNKYRAGISYIAYGGIPVRSPMLLSIPNKDRWFIVIDMAGLIGTTETSVRRVR